MLAVRWTLGLDLPTGFLKGACVCGRQGLDATGWHEAHCGWGGGKQALHDLLVGVLRLILGKAGVHAYPWEPPLSSMGVSVDREPGDPP